VATEKEFLKNFAAGLFSLFQRSTFPRVAVWYPVSDGGDSKEMKAMRARAEDARRINALLSRIRMIKPLDEQSVIPIC